METTDRIHIARCHWSRVMFTADVAIALTISETEALTGLQDGRFGPTIKIGDRIAILRDTLTDHLYALEDSAPPKLHPIAGEQGE